MTIESLPIELRMLAWSVVLGLVQLFAARSCTSGHAWPTCRSTRRGFLTFAPDDAVPMGYLKSGEFMLPLFPQRRFWLASRNHRSKLEARWRRR